MEGAWQPGLSSLAALGKGLYYKDSLHPPGSFRVAFLRAAEKMQKIILQLKEGKIDCLLPPAQLANPTPETPICSHQANPSADLWAELPLWVTLGTASYPARTTLGPAPPPMQGYL